MKPILFLILLLPVAGGEWIHHEDLFLPSAVNSLEFSPDGSMVITGNTDEINVIQFPNLTVQSIDAPGWNQAMDISPDGSWVATGSAETLQIWNTTTWENVTSMNLSTRIYNLEYSPGGQWLASVSQQETLIWSTSDWSLVATLDHPSTVWCSQFSPDGSWLATGSQNGLRIWNSTGWNLELEMNHTYPIASLDVYDQTLVTGGHIPAIWNTSTWEYVQLPVEDVEASAFTPDGSRLATSIFDTFDTRMLIWDATNWTILQSFDATNVYDLGISDSWMVTQSDESRVKIWGEDQDGDGHLDGVDLCPQAAGNDSGCPDLDPDPVPSEILVDLFGFGFSATDLLTTGISGVVATLGVIAFLMRIRKLPHYRRRILHTTSVYELDEVWADVEKKLSWGRLLPQHGIILKETADRHRAEINQDWWA